MHRSARIVALLALVALPTAASEVQVRLNGDLLDVVATAAPLQEVLAQLARQTGMKVVYDGPAPRTLLTVTLPQRTPVEAVLGLFEGLSLNYAIKTDPGGTHIDTLIVSGAPGASGSAGRSPQPQPAQALRPSAPQPAEPQPVEEEPEEQPVEQEEQPAQKAPPTPVPPFSFTEPIPGPGKPGSPFGAGQTGPLALPTPPTGPGNGSQGGGPPVPGAPSPAPTANPSSPS